VFHFSLFNDTASGSHQPATKDTMFHQQQNIPVLKAMALLH